MKPGDKVVCVDNDRSKWANKLLRVLRVYTVEAVINQRHTQRLYLKEAPGSIGLLDDSSSYQTHL